ncbi:hypothetical protein HJG60_010913 [Phyllostomus discolor]|uniref:Uncharacterized protein n=1 Tax=Phyllostomus discolor TaxID=89673 RepID=A0A834AE61_9CHIR|nr:hypothetical protein HJG60_010913 [Phyllostomus discolor]
MPSSLPRMRMQSQQQTIKRHSASPSFHPLFTLLFSSSASSGRYIRYLLYPSSAPLSVLLQLLHPVFQVPSSSCEGPGQSCRRRSFSALRRPGVRCGRTWHGKVGCSRCSSGNPGGWCAHSDTALELGAKTV